MDKNCRELNSPGSVWCWEQNRACSKTCKIGGLANQTDNEHDPSKGNPNYYMQGGLTKLHVGIALSTQSVPHNPKVPKLSTLCRAGTPFADSFMVAVAARNDDKATGIRSGVEKSDKPLYADFALAVLEPCILVAVIPACSSDSQVTEPYNPKTVGSREKKAFRSSSLRLLMSAMTFCISTAEKYFHHQRTPADRRCSKLSRKPPLPGLGKRPRKGGIER